MFHGHKENGYIIKQREEENKKRKDIDKTKNSKDNFYNAHKDMQIVKNIEIGRRAVEFNPQRRQSKTNKQYMQQEELKTERRRNNSQQV